MLSPAATIVQRHDRQRFVTVLFARAEHRETLFTLYAFNHELARAREVASEPTLALIRLHWWREVVQGAARAHEVATPLHEAIKAGRLPQAALLRMIGGRELEAEANIDRLRWRDYLRETSGVLMATAGAVTGATNEVPALTALGAACGAVGLLRNWKANTARGRWTHPDGMKPSELLGLAADMIGRRRRWSAAALPAALPAVFARRAVAGKQTEGIGSRLEVLGAAISRRC